MEFVKTDIDGVLIVKGKRFADNRGFFSELHKEDLFSSNGISRFVQDNMSESSSGVIRGLP